MCVPCTVVVFLGMPGCFNMLSLLSSLRYDKKCVKWAGLYYYVYYHYYNKCNLFRNRRTTTVCRNIQNNILP